MNGLSKHDAMHHNRDPVRFSGQDCGSSAHHPPAARHDHRRSRSAVGAALNVHLMAATANPNDMANFITCVEEFLRPLYGFGFCLVVASSLLYLMSAPLRRVTRPN